MWDYVNYYVFLNFLIIKRSAFYNRAEGVIVV
jgi:hypothetical protein